MKNIYLFLLTFTAPAGVILHFVNQVRNDAYSPDSDTIAIPILMYCLIVYPFQLMLWYKGRGSDATYRIQLWERTSHGDSFVSLFLCIFPIGLFWLSILIEAFVNMALPYAVYSALMIYTTFINRSRLLRATQWNGEGVYFPD